MQNRVNAADFFSNLPDAFPGHDLLRHMIWLVDLRFTDWVKHQAVIGRI
jgi:hypothetical protein